MESVPGLLKRLQIRALYSTWSCRWRELMSLLLKNRLIFNKTVFAPLLYQRWYTWTGDLKCREVKTGFCRKRYCKCKPVLLRLSLAGRATLCPSMGPNGGNVAIVIYGLSEIQIYHKISNIASLIAEYSDSFITSISDSFLLLYDRILLS